MGTVTGLSAHGILADATANGSDLTVLAYSDVSGKTVGISAINRGTGVLSIDARGNVTGEDAQGIYAYNDVNSLGGITISTDAVTGDTYGIEATNFGDGGLSVTSVGTVTGTNGTGIKAWNSGYSTGDLTISATEVSGDDWGIYGTNVGSGALIIVADETAAGKYQNGILAYNYGTDLRITAKDVSGGTSGIYAVNYGSGEMSVDTTGIVEGVNFGIYAWNDGSGDLTVTTTGDVIGSTNTGIKAYKGSSTGNLTIRTANVTGGLDGINAVSKGTGALSITSDGSVLATRNGIYAINVVGGTSLTVEANDVEGGEDGIQAWNYGTGALSITSTGNIIGDDDGIAATNKGTGSLSVISTGVVTGTSGRGISASNESNSTGSLIVDAAADVTGGLEGIAAFNSGTGALSVTATGDVTGRTIDNGTFGGILAINSSNSLGDLTIRAANVSGYDGIYASNYGTGSLSITSTGTVTGVNSGIQALNGANSLGDFVISAYNVSGGADGIFATNLGAGDLSVTSTGLVTAAGLGIVAINSVNSAGDVTILAADVTAGFDGIRAENNGAGALSVTSTGAVTGSNGAGIIALNSSSSAGDVTISADDVSGHYGIIAQSIGTGALSVTSTGTVAGTTGVGILAFNIASSAGDLSISADDVSGRDGIVAINSGAGGLSVTSTGAVTGTNNFGILALNNSTSAGDVTISADDVSGRNIGILARNRGASALNVTSSGSVSGDRSGILAYNAINGTDLTISANDVSGGDASYSYSYFGYYNNSYMRFPAGISALNAGTGTLSITTTGIVSGRIGVFARNYGSGDSITIDTATVTGDVAGIAAFNSGAGILSVTSTESVSGDGFGIYARNDIGSTDLVVDVHDVNGGNIGIFARNEGTGALTVTSSGLVSSNGAGIAALNGVNGTNLTVSANDVGNLDYSYYNNNAPLTVGIYARNAGTGALTITTTGTVAALSGQGIVAFNNNAGTDLSITAASVSGGSGAIYAINYGTGSLSVTVSGEIIGGTGAAISTQSNAGSAVAINLGSTSSVSATSGTAIVDGFGDAVVTINSGAVVNGTIALGDGDDTLSIMNGASLAGVTALSGGSGDFIDTLNLNAAWDGDLSDWERINADSSAGNFAFSGVMSGDMSLTKSGSGTLTLSGIHSFTGPTIVTAGRLNVTGSIASSAVTLQNGASLGGNGTVGALIAQSGSTVSPGNSIGTLSVNGDLTLAAGSVLAMEVSPIGADLITVTGTANIAGDLNVSVSSGQYSFSQQFTLVSANAVTGTFTNTVLDGLGSMFRAKLIYDATSVILQLDPNSLVEASGRTLRGNSLAFATSFDNAVFAGYNTAQFNNLYTQGARMAETIGQLAGERHSAERQATMQSTRVVREAAFDALNAGIAPADETASVTKDAGGVSTTVWMRAAGAWSSAEADDIGSSYKTDQTGILSGVDIAKDGFKLGGMFSQGSTTLNLLSAAQSKIDNVGAALYAGYRQDVSGFAIGFGAGFASNSAWGSRAITAPALAQTLVGRTKSTTQQYFAEASFDFAGSANTRIEPFARIARVELDSKAFAETGGIAALNGDKQSSKLTMTGLGLRGAHAGPTTTLNASIGWQRTSGDRSAATNVALSMLDAPYEVRSVAIDRNAVTLDTQASFRLSSQMTFGVGYNAVVGSNNSSHGARATVRIAF